jgi:hypothetical protein
MWNVFLQPIKVPIDIMEGLSKETADQVADKLGFTGKNHDQVC